MWTCLAPYSRPVWCWDSENGWNKWLVGPWESSWESSGHCQVFHVGISFKTFTEFLFKSCRYIFKNEIYVIHLFGFNVITSESIINRCFGRSFGFLSHTGHFEPKRKNIFSNLFSRFPGVQCDFPGAQSPRAWSALSASVQRRIAWLRAEPVARVRRCSGSRKWCILRAQFVCEVQTCLWGTNLF